MDEIQNLIAEAEAIVAKGADATPEELARLDAIKAEVENLKAQQQADYSRKQASEWISSVKAEQATFGKQPAPRKAPAPSYNPAPAAHTKKHEYSVSRAITRFMEKDGNIDGLEAETDQELRRSYSGTVKGFLVPRFLKKQYANWSTTTGSDLTDAQRSPEYLDVLRAYNPLNDMGVTFREGLKESTKFISFDEDPGLYFPAEGSDGTDDYPESTPYTHTPHTGIVRVPMTRSFMHSNPMAEQFVNDSLAKGIGVGIGRIALAGDGVNEPAGVFVKSGLTSVSLSTLSRANLMKMEQAVDVANADFGSVGYVGSPYTRTALRSTTSVTNFPAWLLADDGTINGYKYHNSMSVPNIGSPVKGALAFGNWSYLEVSLFGNGIDILPDPYSLSKSGTFVVHGYISLDVQFAKLAAFAVSKDISISVS